MLDPCHNIMGHAASGEAVLLASPHCILLLGRFRLRLVSRSPWDFHFHPVGAIAPAGSWLSCLGCVLSGVAWLCSENLFSGAILPAACRVSWDVSEACRGTVRNVMRAWCETLRGHRSRLGSGWAGEQETVMMRAGVLVAWGVSGRS